MLPRYLGVRAILDKTRSYRDEHPFEHEDVPWVYETTERTITMEFCEGPTLAELLEERAVSDDAFTEAERMRRRALNGEDIGFIESIGLAICRILESLHEDEVTTISICRLPTSSS